MPLALSDDLTNEVRTIFSSAWEERAGQVVPDPKDVQLGNHAVRFDRATVLYADLHDSTSMVDSYHWQFAAEIYKAYLHCATRLITAAGGYITSYDGDRVMGLFIGGSQSTRAAKCALKINYAVTKIINPALKRQYPSEYFEVRQCIGIDTSEIRAARTGVRGNNDLVWVGRAANCAAKLTELDHNKPTWITHDVFRHLADDAKYGSDGQLMWEQWTWNEQDDLQIHASDWWWRV